MTIYYAHSVLSKNTHRASGMIIEIHGGHGPRISRHLWEKYPCCIFHALTIRISFCLQTASPWSQTIRQSLGPVLCLDRWGWRTCSKGRGNAPTKPTNPSRTRWVNEVAQWINCLLLKQWIWVRFPVGQYKENKIDIDNSSRLGIASNHYCKKNISVLWS